MSIFTSPNNHMTASSTVVSIRYRYALCTISIRWTKYEIRPGPVHQTRRIYRVKCNVSETVSFGWIMFLNCGRQHSGDTPVRVEYLIQIVVVNTVTLLLYVSRMSSKPAHAICVITCTVLHKSVSGWYCCWNAHVDDANIDYLSVYMFRLLI
jgi:hypothetical protein